MTINTLLENLDLEDEIVPAGGKGRIITFGISLYPQELDYVDHQADIYGLNRSAFIRQLINKERIASQN